MTAQTNKPCTCGPYSFQFRSVDGYNVCVQCGGYPTPVQWNNMPSKVYRTLSRSAAQTEFRRPEEVVTNLSPSKAGAIAPGPGAISPFPPTNPVSYSSLSHALAEVQKNADLKNRPSFDWVWMETAKLVRMRGTCPRRKVGAVIVSDDNEIISTGYNGAPSGLSHCADRGCLIEEETGRCKRTVHAEQNAIIQAGKAANGATLYVTDFPCVECANLIINSGIVRVVYVNPYETQAAILSKVETLFDEANVSIEKATDNAA